MTSKSEAVAARAATIQADREARDARTAETREGLSTHLTDEDMRELLARRNK